MTVAEDDLAAWSEIVGSPAVIAAPSSGQELITRIESLRPLFDAWEAQRVLLMIDRQAVMAAGLSDAIYEELGSLVTAEYDDFSSNPCSDEAAAAAHCASEHGVDVVIGVGGGSCLDVAKFAALAANSGNCIPAMSRGEVVRNTRPLKLVAVPTTSGSGSEATHFAVVYHNGQKVSIEHDAMRPRAVLLDPRFHQAMPARLAAVTGLDALAQSLESLWAVGATPQSCLSAELAARIIAPSLEESVHRATNEARLRMMVAAHLAGQAINLSKTTAAHAISYGLSTTYHIPHGHAVALTLGWVGALNHEVGLDDCCDPRGAADVRQRVELAAAILDCTPPRLPMVIHSLLVRLGLPATLSEVGVKPAEIARLAAGVDTKRLGNNPRRLNNDQIERLLERAMSAP